MDEFHQDAKYRLDKPFGISSFKEEINMAPKVMAQRNGNLQFFRYHEKVSCCQTGGLIQGALLTSLLVRCRAATLPQSSNPNYSPKISRIASPRSGVSARNEGGSCCSGV